ncbi:MAG TPA: ABC transporter permease, partial [Vicinamibacterales bacterium]|nr:ABC transporter permease [Vicinamibacterales bacterium]
RTRGALVTANTFSLLRQPPLLGRDFAPGEDRPEAAPVVILGHGVWKTRYGADPNVIGRVIKVNEVACTVIGVMPEGMQFPVNAEMWRPLINEGARQKRESRSMMVFGRLKPGVSRAEAQAEISAIAGRLRQTYPETNKDIDARLTTFNERFNGGPIRVIFLALMGAVGFVLLIACANVANKLLARSAQRSREVAVRFALGATRRRIVRQLLVESVMLSAMGGVLGLGLTYIGVQLFDRAVADTGKPYWIQFTFDPIVFGYLAAICLGTGIIFGLAPALQVSRTNVHEILKEGGRGTAGGRRARFFRSTMVVVELTLTVVLLVGAGLMIRSFLKMYSLDLGIDTRQMLTMMIALADEKYPKPEQRRIFFESLLPRLEAIPGMQAVAVATAVPAGGTDQREVEIDGRPHPQNERAPRISTITVSPKYFEVLGVGVLRGRGFSDADGAEGAEVAIVNERFVAQHFPAEDPVGRRIRLRSPARGPFPAGPVGKWLTIVGVTPTVRQGDPQAVDPPAVAYLPYRQDAPAITNILARSSTEPGTLAGLVRQEVQALDPNQPVYNVRTMEQVLAQMRWPFRVFGALFTIFALIALVLSAVGIYAVTAYSVTQRTQEIGVRMALGAQTGQVSWMILRQGLVQLAIGLVLGIAGGLGVGRILQVIIVQVSPRDPLTFITIVAVLVLVTIAACVIPARRAARLDPLTALRIE